MPKKIPSAKRKFRLICPVGAVYKVDGRAVRTRHAVMVGGAHSLVYPWVPTGEIWIERMRGGRRDERNILAHEMVEILLMHFKKWSYDRAHDAANQLEQRLRKGIAPKKAFLAFLQRHFRRGDPNRRRELSAALTSAYERY